VAVLVVATPCPLILAGRSPWVRQVNALLTGEIWAHESAEDSDLYPALGRLLGGADPTATMSRAHAEIARLGRLIAGIGDRVPVRRTSPIYAAPSTACTRSSGCTRCRRTRRTCRSATTWKP
jgi:hypothetical protein